MVQDTLNQEHGGDSHLENIDEEESASRPEDPNDSDPVDGHHIDAFVLLAKTPHKWSLIHSHKLGG